MDMRDTKTNRESLACILPPCVTSTGIGLHLRVCARHRIAFRCGVNRCKKLVVTFR